MLPAILAGLGLGGQFLGGMGRARHAQQEFEEKKSVMDLQKQLLKTQGEAQKLALEDKKLKQSILQMLLPYFQQQGGEAGEISAKGEQPEFSQLVDEMSKITSPWPETGYQRPEVPQPRETGQGSDINQLLTDQKFLLLSKMAGMDLTSVGRMAMESGRTHFVEGAGPEGQPGRWEYDVRGERTGEFLPSSVEWKPFEYTESGTGAKKMLWYDPRTRQVLGGPGQTPSLPTQREPGIGEMPINPNDLPMYVHEKTLQSPPFGTTDKQAADQGYKRVTTNQRTQIDSVKGVNEILDQIEKLAEQVFPKTEGEIERLYGGAKRKLGAIAQTNIPAARLERLIGGTLAPMIRSLGEKGALAEGDVKRATKLMFQLTDRSDLVWDSIRQLKQLFSTIQRSVITGSYNTSNPLDNIKTTPAKSEINRLMQLGQ